MKRNSKKFGKDGKPKEVAIFERNNIQESYNKKEIDRSMHKKSGLQNEKEREIIMDK